MHKLAAIILIAFAARGLAGDPEIRNLSVRGLQVGGTTTLTIDGDGLLPNPRLLLPFPATVALKGMATDKQATFEVTLGNDVTPGYSHLYLSSEQGISTPVIVAVDRLPQRPFGPSIESLPVALHGTLTGSKAIETTFTGKAGQIVQVEIEAQRLGAKFRPILHLYDSKKLQLAWSWGLPSLQGDARLEATLPKDGTYLVTLHDAEYAAPAGGTFRLRVGRWDYVDQVFPPAIGKETTKVESIGSAAVALTLPKQSGNRFLPVPWPNQGAWSGPRPFVTVSTKTEIVEPVATGKPHDIPGAPVGVSGRLTTSYEQDSYRLPVTPGSRIRFEVLAERIGSPIDAALVLRNEAGADLSRAEDGPGTLDPFLEYTVPNTMTSLVVAVVDVQGRGSNRAVYRLMVDPIVAGPTSADFELSTTVPRLSLSANGRAVFPVLVERKGYIGPIELKASGLPTGVKLDGLTIPAGAEGTLVTVMAGNQPFDAAQVFWQGAGGGMDRPVLLKGHLMERLQPWMAGEFAVSSRSQAGAPLQVEWKDPKPGEALVPGKKISLPIAVKNAENASSVRLTLVTGQSVATVAKNQPDPARSIRVEKPIELPAKTDTGELVVIVPNELSAEVYDIAIRAESLAADKKTVLSTAVTSVRRLPVRFAFTLQLEGPPRRDAKRGTTIELMGKLARSEGFANEVLLAVTGLPAGVKVEPLTVKEGSSDFRLTIALPATVPLGEIKGIKLSGSYVPDPKVPTQRIRGRDIELSFNVLDAK